MVINTLFIFLQCLHFAHGSVVTFMKVFDSSFTSFSASFVASSSNLCTPVQLVPNFGGYGEVAENPGEELENCDEIQPALLIPLWFQGLKIPESYFL